ncbi:MAG: 2-amino-4-hydroxy-6-hydroxymethyldihydropteridine diphosphokinase [Pirellulaceae bacterium]|nr:2-amino-4-hydroxy-6-hydroxymethyldihydropteridine diphosphokinase [Pirellulaceae bacterium]
MATALLGLGSNLGDRAAALARSIELLKEEPRIRVEAVSSSRLSKPAGGPEGQGEFLNAAARLATSLSPEELLAKLLAIEDQMGRIREGRWGPRVIDLDLLLYEQVEMKTPTLELPHPRMCYRRFVLEPAAVIAGEMVWPVNGWSVARLVRNLDTSAKYIAFRCAREDFERIISPISKATNCRVIWETSLSNAEPHDEKWTLGSLRDNRLMIQQPRLVFYLEPEDAALAGEFLSVDQLRRQEDSPPSLWLSMNEPDRIEREVLAAMQAME